MPTRRPVVLVLDQDFPNSPLLNIKFPDLYLVPLRRAHSDLTAGYEDWEVLQQLRARGNCDGFVTLDVNMLALAKEMVVLHQTRLSLVVLQGTDNDPMVAGGALVASSGKLVRLFNRRRPQIFRVQVPSLRSERPWDAVKKLAARAGLTERGLYSREKLTFQELTSRRP